MSDALTGKSLRMQLIDDMQYLRDLADGLEDFSTDTESAADVRAIALRVGKAIDELRAGASRETAGPTDDEAAAMVNGYERRWRDATYPGWTLAARADAMKAVVGDWLASRSGGGDTRGEVEARSMRDRDLFNGETDRSGETGGGRA